MKEKTNTETLVELVATLRGPNGCPWDKEQTHESLAPYAIEETYELVDAIESKDDEELKGELGDVLFQVAIHAQLAQERGAFTFEDVAQSINEKLIRRHPHVFGDTKVESIAEIWKNWEQIKKEEKANQKEKKKGFGIPKGLPSLQAAHKIGDKTHRAEFDWKNAQDVWLKVEEEIDELKIAMKSQDQKEIVHELGDVLFSLSQLARHLQLEAEVSLREANRRFEERYFKMLEIAKIDDFKNYTDEEKEELWQKAKALLKK